MEVLRTLPDNSVQCCVTSPPYFGLRDYEADGQLGQEATHELYVANLVALFREVRRVLRQDGTFYLNVGDSYANDGKGRKGADKSTLTGGGGYQLTASPPQMHKPWRQAGNLKRKDLIGIPWMLAFALRADGWYLRSEVIWCLSGGAWVYARTQKGDMPVMVKDLVRLDPSTVQLWNGGKWTQVLGWGPSNDQTERIELVLRSGERIGCTGGHLWPTQRGNVAARDLAVGDIVRTCTLPESGAAEPPYLNPDLLWLIGLYLAEGCPGKEHSLQLGLNADEEGWFPRIEAAAATLGATATRSIDGNSMSVRLYGRVLCAVIQEFVGGKDSHDLHLRCPAWRLSNSSLRLIAKGYLDGDGSAQGPRIRLGFCRNYALERDLRTLAARLGATLTLKPAFTTCNGEKKPSFRGEWRWERTGHHNEKDRGEIMEIRASRARKFWDIAVEDEPHLFALSSGVLTHNCKRSPMPESVRDRPTKSHEQIFLLTKSPRYFYDVIGSQEQAVGGTPGNRTHKAKTAYENGAEEHRTKAGLCEVSAVATRNMRSVWSMSSYPLKAKHFAAFPPELVRRCLSAGISEKGCCPACGKPWVRQVEKRRVPTRSGKASKVKRASQHEDSPYELMSGSVVGNRDPQRHITETVTIGWQAACKCEAGEPVPCTVLDPFHGAGTTWKVCERLGAHYIGCDLNEEYLQMSVERPPVTFPHEKKARRAQRAQPANNSQLLLPMF